MSCLHIYTTHLTVKKMVLPHCLARINLNAIRRLHQEASETAHIVLCKFVYIYVAVTQDYVKYKSYDWNQKFQAGSNYFLSGIFFFFFCFESLLHLKDEDFLISYNYLIRIKIFLGNKLVLPVFCRNQLFQFTPPFTLEQRCSTPGPWTNMVHEAKASYLQGSQQVGKFGSMEAVAILQALPCYQISQVLHSPSGVSHTSPPSFPPPSSWIWVRLPPRPRNNKGKLDPAMSTLCTGSGLTAWSGLWTDQALSIQPTGQKGWVPLL